MLSDHMHAGLSSKEIFVSIATLEVGR